MRFPTKDMICKAWCNLFKTSKLFSFSNKLRTLNFHGIFRVRNLCFDTYLKTDAVINFVIMDSLWQLGPHQGVSIFFHFTIFFKLARDCPLLISPSSPERILPDVTLRPKNLDDLICVGWQIERKPRKSSWTTERVELLLNILKSSRLNHINWKLILKIKGKFRFTAAKCLSCADFVCALLTGHVTVF